MIDMENLTVPIGLTPKVKKGEVPDLKGIVVQELQYAFMARHYNLFEEEKNLVWPDDCEYHPYIEDLNWLIETRIKEFRDENVEQKQKEQDLDKETRFYSVYNYGWRFYKLQYRWI